MLGNVFGLLAILAGIKLVLLPMGLFEDLDNETAAGSFHLPRRIQRRHHRLFGGGRKRKAGPRAIVLILA